jgi:hypothetical protein
MLLHLLTAGVGTSRRFVDAQDLDAIGDLRTVLLFRFRGHASEVG